jgi:putative flippase GtrA
MPVARAGWRRFRAFIDVSTRRPGGLVRFSRFNLVGAAGLGVQLMTLAALTQVAGWHYLPAAAAAIGVTLGHNFLWHVRWTWQDRNVRGPRVGVAFTMFVSVNGAVSVLGSLLLMPVLVEIAGLPVLPANVVAVGACGLANYWLGDRVCFPEPDPTSAARETSRTV